MISRSFYPFMLDTKLSPQAMGMTASQTLTHLNLTLDWIQGCQVW
jgi:hypothetical protein